MYKCTMFQLQRCFGLGCQWTHGLQDRKRCSSTTSLVGSGVIWWWCNPMRPANSRNDGMPLEPPTLLVLTKWKFSVLAVVLCIYSIGKSLYICSTCRQAFERSTESMIKAIIDKWPWFWNVVFHLVTEPLQLLDDLHFYYFEPCF